jgi:transcriptional regulator with XRE-family HTH domain
MKWTYQIRVWQEDDWWLARVVAASEDADRAPLNAVTQARSLAKIESMARDLIATILDADEANFDIELEYELPSDIGELVCQAKGARAWLDAAQDLWQERSTVAARALTERGYSLREAATLLGLSHQRIDQLLGGHADHEQSKVLIFQCKSNANARSWLPSGTADTHDVDALLVVRRNLAAHSDWAASCFGEDMDAQFSDCVRTLVSQVARHVSQRSDPIPRVVR